MRYLIALCLAASLAVAARVPVHGQATAAFHRTGHEPYRELTLAHLRERAYGSGTFQVERTLQVTSAFTRTLIRFDSDGLSVYGFMNTPRGRGPFPVVIVLHGYVNPRTYRTPYAYTQRYADALAREGFLVLHPDYRGHGRSEGVAEGVDNLFRVGYAVDVLNLAAHARRLPNVNPDAIGLFGHSMGGGIAQRVIAVDRDIKAVVLYGSMSGDERLNIERIRNVFRRVPMMPEDAVPLELWSAISPITYLADVQAAIEIHHGARDLQVPIEWSRDLSQRLSALGKPVTLFEYPEAGHILRGQDYATMMHRVTDFFNRTLRSNPSPRSG